MFFEMINKTGKVLVVLIKKKSVDPNNHTRNGKGSVTSDLKEVIFYFSHVPLINFKAEAKWMKY